MLFFLSSMILKDHSINTKPHVHYSSRSITIAFSISLLSGSTTKSIQANSISRFEFTRIVISIIAKSPFRIKEKMSLFHRMFLLLPHKREGQPSKKRFLLRTIREGKPIKPFFIKSLNTQRLRRRGERRTKSQRSMSTLCFFPSDDSPSSSSIPQVFFAFLINIIKPVEELKFGCGTYYGHLRVVRFLFTYPPTIATSRKILTRFVNTI